MVRDSSLSPVTTPWQTADSGQAHDTSVRLGHADGAPARLAVHHTPPLLVRPTGHTPPPLVRLGKSGPMQDDELRRLLISANPWWDTAPSGRGPTAWTASHRLLRGRGKFDLGYRAQVKYGRGILATKSILNLDTDVWAVPAPLLALLLE